MRAFQTFLFLRGLCGQIKQGLGVFPSPPYQCPAAEVGAELSVAARDEQSHILCEVVEDMAVSGHLSPKSEGPCKGSRRELWPQTSSSQSKHTLL